MNFRYLFIYLLFILFIHVFIYVIIFLFLHFDQQNRIFVNLNLQFEKDVGNSHRMTTEDNYLIFVKQEF
jgi:hypothetical protein